MRLGAVNSRCLSRRGPATTPTCPPGPAQCGGAPIAGSEPAGHASTQVPLHRIDRPAGCRRAVRRARQPRMAPRPEPGWRSGRTARHPSSGGAAGAMGRGLSGRCDGHRPARAGGALIRVRYCSPRTSTMAILAGTLSTRRSSADLWRKNNVEATQCMACCQRRR